MGDKYTSTFTLLPAGPESLEPLGRHTRLSGLSDWMGGREVALTKRVHGMLQPLLTDLTGRARCRWVIPSTSNHLDSLVDVYVYRLLGKILPKDQAVVRYPTRGVDQTQGQVGERGSCSRADLDCRAGFRRC